MSRTVVFWQDDFPFCDALPVSQPILDAALTAAEFIGLDDLAAALGSQDASLLVLPHGSAFAFDAWPDIYRYLQRGGNLVTLGGSPFEIPVYRRRQGFFAGRPTVAYQKRLFINQAWPIEVGGLSLRPAHPWFGNIGGGWQARRAWSLMVRLSDESYYRREGSHGVISAQIEPLVQAVSTDGRVLATPVVLIDHYHNNFAGGRWVLVNLEAEAGFTGSEEALRLFATCERVARRGALQLDARPAFATVASGEPPSLIVHCRSWQDYPDAQLALRLENGAGEQVHQEVVPLPLGQAPQHLALPLPAPARPGPYTLHLRLRSDAGLLAIASSGFYCRDDALLRGSPALEAAGEFFGRHGRPVPIVGTTYMADRVHRQFLFQPNPALWRRDFAAMAQAGVNFVRTGIWTGYEQVMLEPGIVREDVLRAFEAYLHAAREQSIHVQFCLFAFQPDSFGTSSPYLDPEMRARQKEYICAFVRRFRDVPDLSWDLINEPSQFDPRHLFQQRPYYDEHERRAWNKWLERSYLSYDDLLAAWNTTAQDVGPWGDLRQPAVEELTFHQRWESGKPLIVNDWRRFEQEAFADWASEMTAAIRACGSSQMVTVGQDEGAVDGRPSPWFHQAAIDHTCIHTWWLNDALLWDQLCTTIPGKPLLIQETGIMQYEQLDEYSRRDEENRARLLERKFALALGAGAGFVQWLWNTNTHMESDNEVAIGALRADGSEKPELRCTRLMAPFARALGRHAGPSETPLITVVQPQSLLGSVLQPLALRALQASVRTLAYELGMLCRVVGENACQLPGKPGVIILPYPRAFGEEAWRALLDCVRRGYTLIASGPIGDAHFHETERLRPLGVGAHIEGITAREAWQEAPGGPVRLTYSGEALNMVDRWRFEGGGSLREIGLGAGRIVLAAYPVELNDNAESVARFYAGLLQAEEHSRGLSFAGFGSDKPAGVLVWPRRFPTATLYTCVSESAEPCRLTVRDEESGARFSLELGSERAAMVLLDRDCGRLLAAYVHGSLVWDDDEVWPGGEAALWWEDGQMRSFTLR